MEAERLKQLIRVLEKSLTRKGSAWRKKEAQNLIAQYRAELEKIGSDETKSNWRKNRHHHQSTAIKILPATRCKPKTALADARPTKMDRTSIWLPEWCWWNALGESVQYYFAMIYVHINIPYLIFCKIGYTRIGRLGTRRREVDKHAPGWLVTIFFVPVPGALYIEKEIHKMCAFLRVRFYRGDGKTEWYYLPAAIVPILFGLMVWGCYFFILKTFYHGLLY